MTRWLVSADCIVTAEAKNKFALFPNVPNRASCSIFIKIFTKGPSLIDVKEYTGENMSGIFTVLNISQVLVRL